MNSLLTTHEQQYIGIVTVETRFIASLFIASLLRKPTDYHLDAINRVSTEINLWLIAIRLFLRKNLPIRRIQSFA